MRIKNVAAISLSFLTVSSLYQDEAAARPADQVVRWVVHEMPGDPLSPIIQTVNVGLNVVNQYDNGDIDWIPVSATIIDLDEFGNETATWQGSDLLFETADGVWTVHHLDPLAPADTEFALPPLLVGTGTSADLSLDSWFFEILGDLYTPPITETGKTTTLNAVAPPKDKPPKDPPPDDDPEDDPLPDEDDPTPIEPYTP